MELMKKGRQFFQYWYIRYLLATEMYVMEPWEKTIIYGIVALLFSAMWYLNYNFMLVAVSQLRGAPAYWGEKL